MKVLTRLMAYHTSMLEQTRSKSYRHVRDEMYDTLPTFINLLRELMEDPTASSSDRRWAADRFAAQLNRMHEDGHKEKDRTLTRKKLDVAAKRANVEETKTALEVAAERKRIDDLLKD